MSLKSTLVVIAVIVIAIVLAMNAVVDECSAKGGETVWTGGGMGHLCVSPDGRILP